MDWKEEVSNLLAEAARTGKSRYTREAIRIMIDHWPESPQDACQKHCEDDDARSMAFMADTIQAAHKALGTAVGDDLAMACQRFREELDEFRRLHEEGQETIKECAKLRRSLHAVISDAKEALGVPENGSLVEACRELDRAYNRQHEMIKRAMEHLGAGKFENVYHAAERVAKERDASQDRLHDCRDQFRAVEHERTEYEQTIGEIFEALEDRGLVRVGTKLADDVLRVIDERDALQDALDEQMAENGRMAARVKYLEKEKESRIKHDMMRRLGSG